MAGVAATGHRTASTTPMINDNQCVSFAGVNLGGHTGLMQRNLMATTRLKDPCGHPRNLNWGLGMRCWALGMDSALTPRAPGGILDLLPQAAPLVGKDPWTQHRF